MAPQQQPSLADQAVILAEYAAKALFAAEKLEIKTKPVKPFLLNAPERATVAEIPALAATLKNKLAKKNAAVTVGDVAGMVMAISESYMDSQPKQQVALLLIVQKLIGIFEHNIAPIWPMKVGKPKPADTVFQFKITLLGAKPTIWRRIQVQDCTLDQLHEHIQTAMGWTNSHLHHFRVGQQLYGDPRLMEENMEEMDYRDSTATMLSDIVPKAGQRFRFVYEYDFGDNWQHEVLFEGCPQAEAGRKYPVCLKGKRACPPEDCGGVWGYADFLDAIRNPQHAQHQEMLDWIGGRFDAEDFDPAAATKAMKKGLPDWRRMG